MISEIINHILKLCMVSFPISVGSFLTIFMLGFQICSFYKQFWRNKNEHKNHIIKIKEGEEEDVGF